jgi:hypothetical protein
MSRNLRIAHLPSMHPRLRFSGYLTDPKVTDQRLMEALGPFFVNLKLWRTSNALPNDWPTQDDSMIQSPPTGVTPIWGEGDDTSAAVYIGDPETPWRLLVGSGQLVIENVWLFDAQADPWPAALAPCPTVVCPPITNCPPSFMDETVRPPSQCNAVPIGVLGAALGVTATAAGLWWWKS